MRKSLLVAMVVGVLGALAIAVAGGAATTSRTRTVSFTGTVTGAQINANQSAFKYHDSYWGNGAGVQTTTLNGLNGTDKNVVYYGNGVARATDTFTIGAPDANGNAPVTGKGHDGGGTGRFKGVTSTFTITGTVNVNSGQFKATLKGRYTIPVR